MNELMNNQQQQLMSSQMMNMTQMNQQPPQQLPHPQLLPMNMSYGMWAPPQFNSNNPNAVGGGGVGGMLPPPARSSGFGKAGAANHNSLGPRNNWKGKKLNNKPNEKRRKEMIGLSGGGTGNVVGNTGFNNYQPPALNELQQQNRVKARKFFPRKKFNNKNNINSTGNVSTSSGVRNYNNNGNRKAPFAPRNTTSFLIRAKKSGGIASLVSPCPVTPAVLPSPIFSPSREVLVDMAKEEWGVDGYGSMKGLIRLRSEAHEEEDEGEGGSSGSDVEEHVEVERRLDHDLSRFEMIYDPSNGGMGMEYHNLLENRVDDQDTHIAQLEEENLILKERLFLMEREFADLRRRLQCLERQEGCEVENENESENESGSGEGEGHSMEETNEDLGEENVAVHVSFSGKDEDDHDDVVVKAAEKDEGDHNNVVVDAAEPIEENAKGKAGKAEKCIDPFVGFDKNVEDNVAVEESETKEEENVEVKLQVDGEVKAEANNADNNEETELVGDVYMEEVGQAED